MLFSIVSSNRTTSWVTQAYLTAQIFEPVLAHVHAIECHSAAIDVIESRQQADEG